MQIPCGKTRRVYKNRSKHEQTITVTVDDTCGGAAKVELLNADGNIIGGETETLDDGGGSVTFDVAKGQALKVTCSGGNDAKHCEVTISR